MAKNLLIEKVKFNFSTLLLHLLFQVTDSLVGCTDCYKDLYSRDGIWFKIINMKPIENFEEISLSSKTLMGNSMESVLRSSASSVYFECTDDINL